VTRRLYHEDPDRLEFDAAVVDHVAGPEPRAVILDQTAFYAESGGQPWDTGRLGEARVTSVVELADGRISHTVDRALPLGPVHGHVDAERRRDHSQQHHGQHLLSRAFVETSGAATVSFHLGPETSTIDLDREVDAGTVRAAERLTNQVVWEGRPVSVRSVTRQEAAALGVSLPDGQELIRLIDVRGFDLQACGGTHPRATSEVGVVCVAGWERYKRGTRVRFVCGHRALAAAHVQREALEALSALLSAAPAALPDAARRLLAQREADGQRAKELLRMAVAGEARRLLEAGPGTPRIVSAVYDGWPPADLRQLAVAIVDQAPAIALLAARAEKAHVVFARSSGLELDLGPVFRETLARLGGRGGGQGAMLQGGADRVEGLEPALADAAARLREGR